MQQDLNRSRQGLREHRRANRPKYLTSAGVLDTDDVGKLQSHPANAILELNGLAPGQKAEELVQPMKMFPIDPNVYDVGPMFQDLEKVVGAQEANLGGTSKSTATESTIAESSRMSALSSAVDELDDMLSEMAAAASQVLLTELDGATARKIAGHGAVWPTLSKQDVADELYLEVKAGSSGRPNKVMNLQNWEKVMPLLIQTPGVDPYFVLSETLRRLDDDLLAEDVWKPGLPSIAAMNSASGPAGGAKQTTAHVGRPDQDPNMQGEHGNANSSQIPGRSGGIAPENPRPQVPM
ncbi:MAG: hypothetical protein WCK05_15985, partial [Planctomycetota bacterium]